VWTLHCHSRMLRLYPHPWFPLLTQHRRQLKSTLHCWIWGSLLIRQIQIRCVIPSWSIMATIRLISRVMRLHALARITEIVVLYLTLIALFRAITFNVAHLLMVRHSRQPRHHWYKHSLQCRPLLTQGMLHCHVKWSTYQTLDQVTWSRPLVHSENATEDILSRCCLR
jgi:hypothetical protein